MVEPTVEQIEEWKKKYGKLSKTVILGQSYIYHKLSRKEHLAIQKEVFPEGIPSNTETIKAEENASIEDKIVKQCIVWPENINTETLDAGVPPVLVPSILYVSGFVPISEPEEL